MADQSIPEMYRGSQKQIDDFRFIAALDEMDTCEPSDYGSGVSDVVDKVSALLDAIEAGEYKP